MIREKFRSAITACSTKTVGAGIEMFRPGGNVFDAAALAGSPLGERRCGSQKFPMLLFQPAATDSARL